MIRTQTDEPGANKTVEQANVLIMQFKYIAVVIFVCCLAMVNIAMGGELTLPEISPKEIQVVGRLSFPPIRESSGLVRSRTWPGVYWTHNDSGDQARIFSVRADGSIIKPQRIKDDEYTGTLIRGADNIDWEDIALDADGNLYIGDFGNNGNARRDLGVYVLKEPNPFERVVVGVLWRIPFEYPDQKQYPPLLKEKNYDAEALFAANGRLYILTKNRGNSRTNLYRFATFNPNQMNRLVRLGAFDTRAMVTAADTSADGSRLVVLTYKALWMFERASADAESWLDGKVWWLPISNGRQCEGVCFANDAILITNEDRDLLRVPIADLLKLRE